MIERYIGYAIAAVATIVSILGLLGVVQETVVLSAVLAVIALVSVGLTHYYETVRQLKVAVEAQTRPLHRFRFEYPDLSESILSAESVDVIAGISLKTTAGQYHSQFLTSIAAGCRVRLIGPNPDNSSLNQLILTASPGRTSVDQARFDVITGLITAQRLAGPDFSNRATVKVLDYLPTFGLVVIKSKAGPTRVWFKPMAFRVTNGEFPVLEFDEDRDGAWVRYFQRQFENHWTLAADVTDHDYTAELAIKPLNAGSSPAVLTDGVEAP